MYVYFPPYPNNKVVKVISSSRPLEQVPKYTGRGGFYNLPEVDTDFRCFEKYMEKVVNYFRNIKRACQ